MQERIYRYTLNGKITLKGRFKHDIHQPQAGDLEPGPLSSQGRCSYSALAVEKRLEKSERKAFLNEFGKPCSGRPALIQSWRFPLRTPWAARFAKPAFTISPVAAHKRFFYRGVSPAMDGKDAVPAVLAGGTRWESQKKDTGLNSDGKLHWVITPPFPCERDPLRMCTARLEKPHFRRIFTSRRPETFYVELSPAREARDGLSWS